MCIYGFDCLGPRNKAKHTSASNCSTFCACRRTPSARKCSWFGQGSGHLRREVQVSTGHKEIHSNPFRRCLHHLQRQVIAPLQGTIVNTIFGWFRDPSNCEASRFTFFPHPSLLICCSSSYVERSPTRRMGCIHSSAIARSTRQPANKKDIADTTPTSTVSENSLRPSCGWCAHPKEKEQCFCPRGPLEAADNDDDGFGELSRNESVAIECSEPADPHWWIPLFEKQYGPRGPQGVTDANRSDHHSLSPPPMLPLQRVTLSARVEQWQNSLLQ